MHRIRFVVAFVGFALAVGLAVLHYAVLAVAHRLMRLLGLADEQAHRIRMSGWPAIWGPVVFAVVRPILGFTVDFRLPIECREPAVNPESLPPCIVVSNHVTMMDMMFIALFLKKMGRRNLRWIMSAESKNHFTLIPNACEEGGSVFVKRSGDVNAKKEVRRCADMARSDGASVVLFPEGTRFRGAKPGSGYSHVLPPKLGGFGVLRDALPEFAVLSLTMQWEQGSGGAGFSSVSGYVGKHLTVHARFDRFVTGISSEQFLKDDFERKEQLLRQAAGH